MGPSARRLFESVDSAIPARVRERVKRGYWRQQRRTPLLAAESGQGGRSRHRPPRLGVVGVLPGLPLPTRRLDAALGAHAGDVDLALVAPGPLDPVLGALIDCEDAGIPLVALVGSEEELRSETVACATAICATTERLARAATEVVPAEFVTTVPTVARIRPLPLVTPSNGNGSHVLSWGGGDPTKGTADLGPVVRVPPHLDAHDDIAELARHAIALLAPSATAPAHEFTLAAALAACGTPVVGPSGPEHPLKGLLTAIRAGALVPSDTAAAIEALRSEHALRAIAGTRARRYALRHLSAGAFIRRLLDITRLPSTPWSVSAIVEIGDAAELPSLRASLARQSIPPTDVVLAVPRGQLPGAMLEIASFPWPVSIVVADRRWLLRALKTATGKFVAFLTGRTLYGSEHLRDLLLELDASGAWMCGQTSEFLYDRDRDETARTPLRSDRHSGDLLAGTTLLAKDRALRDARLGRAHDPGDLQCRFVRAGGRLHVVHPYGALRAGHLDDTALERRVGSDWSVALPDGDGGLAFGPVPRQAADDRGRSGRTA